MGPPRNNASVALATKLKDVMQAAGVRKADYAKRLAEVLGISAPQAYKKLAGASELTVGQVKLFDAAYHTSLLAPALPVEGDQSSVTPLEDAYLVIGKRVPCQVRIGRPIEDFPLSRYVAYRSHDTWQIEETTGAAIRGPMWEVEQISLHLDKSTPRSLISLGIVGDAIDTEALAQFLSDQGYQVKAYAEASTALRGIETTRFDGFFLDWMLGSSTCEALIRSIRSTCGPIPIIVVTSNGYDEPEAEAQIASLIRTYGVDCRARPIKLHILTARMLDAVEKQR